MKRIERVRAFLRRTATALSPSEAAWHGASVGVYVLATALVLAFFTIYFMQDFTLQKLPAFLVQIGALFLLGVLALLVFRYIGKLAPSYRFALFVLAPFIIVVFAPGDEKQSAVFGTALILIASFIGAGIAVLRKEGFEPARQKITLAITALGIGGLLVGLYATFSDKDSANPLLDGYVLEDRTLDLPNPGLPGTHDVLTLTYGSGQDKTVSPVGCVPATGDSTLVSCHYRHASGIPTVTGRIPWSWSCMAITRWKIFLIRVTPIWVSCSRAAVLFLHPLMRTT